MQRVSETEPGRAVPRAVGARLARWLVVGMCVLASGCASLMRPPADLDLRQAEIATDAAPPVLTVDGYAGKGSAAGLGAAKGLGAGVATGTVLCMGTGLFFPLCVAAIVPATTTIGAVSWATAAAVSAEGADAVAAKRDLLKTDLATAPYPALLAMQLHDAAQAGLAIDLPDAAPGAPPRPWRLEVAVTEVACDDNRPGHPYALRVEGRVRVQRTGDTAPSYQKVLVARTEALHTTDEWRADGAAAAKAGLEQSLQVLAQGLLKDLARAPAAAR